MAIQSYADLQAQVADYLARSDLTSQIKNFITAGEIRLGRDLRLRNMLRVVTTTTTADDATVTLPPDYNAMRDLHISGTYVSTLAYLSPSQLFNSGYSVETGLPKNYTILSTEIQLAPIPDQAYTLQMLYYAIPAYLSDTNTTNTWLTVCPDLLLYAALAEAEPYLMNDSRIQVWAAMYDRGVQSLTISDDEGEYAGTSLSVMRSPR